MSGRVLQFSGLIQIVGGIRKSFVFVVLRSIILV